MPAPRAAADWGCLWSDVDPQVKGSLTDAQMHAISDAVERNASHDNPADIRISFAGFFVVLMFGRERRDGRRRKAKRCHKPLLTVRNLAVISILFGSIGYTTLSLSGFLLGLWV